MRKERRGTQNFYSAVPHAAEARGTTTATTPRRCPLSLLHTSDMVEVLVGLA